jgi:hypothetical protein
MRVFAEQTEVRVLIDTHGDQALNLGNRLLALRLRLIRPNLRVRSRKRRNTLHRGEEDPANIRTLIEPKRTADLVKRNQLRKLPRVHEEVAANVLEITVDERLLQIEPKRNNILGVLHGVVQRLLKRQTILEQRLLVIRKHEHERDVEHILQPLCECERDRVAQVQTA